MNDLRTIFSKLPDVIRESLDALPEDVLSSLEEIRLHINQPVLIKSGNSEAVIEVKQKRVITRELMDNTLNNLLNYSMYAYEDDIAKGYITIEGGHRVGICGSAVVENGSVKLLKNISSVNIRRSQEFKGIADRVLKEIFDPGGGLQNVIIVSPPKCGKTTLLRDITRVLSNRGMHVGLCDERSEIAGMYLGIPSYDIGPRTDVMDACPKAEGMVMLIRSMAPDVLITDEIGKDEDIHAIKAALSAGVKIITTIHGDSYDDLMISKLGELVSNKWFSRIIFLTNTPSTGTIKEVIYV